jgi:hypothetical protein
MRYGRVPSLLAALCCTIAAAGGAALAQGTGQGGGAGMTQSDAPQNVPRLDLSESQRQAIYQSISTRQAKKDTAPPGFRPAVGAQVPASIELEPLPKAITELVPKTADYQYAFVANQVLIVDPRSRTVVELIH